MSAWRVRVAGLLLCCCSLISGSVSSHLQGPVFLQEPPPRLDFSNSSGAMLSCSAHGSPPPHIRWLDANDKELTHIPRLSDSEVWESSPTSRCRDSSWSKLYRSIRHGSSDRRASASA